jgi:hypothetical protein
MFTIEPCRERRERGQGKWTERMRREKKAEERDWKRGCPSSPLDICL